MEHTRSNTRRRAFNCATYFLSFFFRLLLLFYFYFGEYIVSDEDLDVWDAMRVNASQNQRDFISLVRLREIFPASTYDCYYYCVARRLPRMWESAPQCACVCVIFLISNFLRFAFYTFVRRAHIQASVPNTNQEPPDAHTTIHPYDRQHDCIHISIVHFHLKENLFLFFFSFVVCERTNVAPMAIVGHFYFLSFLRSFRSCRTVTSTTYSNTSAMECNDIDFCYWSCCCCWWWWRWSCVVVEQRPLCAQRE